MYLFSGVGGSCITTNQMPPMEFITVISIIHEYNIIGYYRHNNKYIIIYSQFIGTSYTFLKSLFIHCLPNIL